MAGKRRSRRQWASKRIAVLPSLVTLGNGLCGFGAIHFAAKIHSGMPVDQVHYCLVVVGWLIMAGMILDALDGRIARMAHTTSDFGGQLDSLCDLVTFGVAPAILLIKLGTLMPLIQLGIPIPSQPLWVMAAMFMACAALRLARFNVESTHAAKDHMSFTGLPSPAAAGAVAVIALMYGPLMHKTYCSIELGRAIYGTILTAAPFLTVALAVLMVSPIKYPHLASRLLSGHRSFNHLVEVVLAIVFVALLRELAIALLFWAYVASGPVGAVWAAWRPAREPVDATPADPVEEKP